MKQTKTSFLCTFFILGILMVFAFSCSDVHLKKLAPEVVTTKSSGFFCISDPTEIPRFMKFLFIIDKSGSNGNSDPGGVKRSINIENFVNENDGNPYYKYGMIAFEGDNGAQAYIFDQNPQVPTFTHDKEKVFKATKKIRDASDGGNTPYKSALDAAYLAIKNDLEMNKDESSTYMVFFVSDGKPTDVQNNTDLENLVHKVTQQSGKIYLSTAYYGMEGDKAIDLLKTMGEVYGKGKFINFESQTDWNFNDLVVKPTHEPWQLKNFIVYNINSGFCEDGSVDVDSDGDGMCDKDELHYDGIQGRNGIVYHFDPQKRFTMGGAVSDYFKWRELRYGEVMPTSTECSDRSDEDHDLLSACEENYVKNDRPSSGVAHNADPRNPDTDRDGVIDGIEVFVYFTRSLAFALDSFNLFSTQLDGEEQAGIQIAQHRNPLAKDLGIPAYDTRLEKISDPNKDCYQFHQDTLPIYPTLSVEENDTLPGLGHKSGENVILIYYLQTPQSDPQGDGVYMYSVQKIDLSPSLTVQDQVFTPYLIPKNTVSN